MSVVVSPNVVLNPSNPDGIDGNNGAVGWHNLVTAAGVVATSQVDGYPATNVANPLTFPSAGWRATTSADQALTIDIPIAEPIDYLAIAKHNLYDAQSRVSVDAGVSAVFTPITPEIMVGDNRALMFFFVQQNMDQIRLNLKMHALAPQVAVIYVGRILRLQRRIYVGHTPMPFGTKTDVITGRSEGGDYLGSIVTGQTTQSEIAQQNLTPIWVREQLRPWLVQANRKVPFFWAWRPLTYPTETGFCWFLSDVVPKNSGPRDLMSFSGAIEGIAS